MDEELEKLRGDHKLGLFELLKRSKPYIKKEIGPIILSLILIFINIGIDVLLPLFIEQFVLVLTNVAELHTTLSMVIGLVLGYLALGLINQGLLFIQSMLLQKAGQRIVYSLRMEVFTHIENMSLNQFNEMPVGALVTRVATYTASMSDLFTDSLTKLIRNFLTSLGVFVIMMTISIKLSLFLLLFAVAAGVISFIFGKVIGKIFHNQRMLLSDINTFLNENLSGMRIIQVFNQETRKDNEFIAKNEKLRRANYNIVLAFAFYRPIINLLYYGSLATTFGVGLNLGLVSAEIVAFYLYLSNFFRPIQEIADQLNSVQRALTASERLFNLLDVPPEVVDKPDAKEIDHFIGKIEFKNVWFAYEEDNWILKDVSFVIKPKQTVAFVGATGAGKTTILSLIVRNYEIQKGQILIDDVDIADIKIESLRRAIGQMLQDVTLFSGTIKTNITLHDESFTLEEINEACDYVSASSFINKLPLGLDEEVIERGENLSAGQRQLLSFARTVLHKPQILILDEATANIDTETEITIQQSLEKMKNIGTMLVVAHRLSTIQHADNIIVLQNGEIIESGTHQQLLKKHGYYHKLYQVQFEE